MFLIGVIKEEKKKYMRIFDLNKVQPFARQRRKKNLRNKNIFFVNNARYNIRK